MTAGRILLTLLSAEIAFFTVAAFALAPIVPAQASSAQTASLIDCEEFIDQAEAQRFFEVKGGPLSDPYYLDGDGDGIACEPGPPPTPVSESHAEYCDGFLDYLVDSEAPDDTAGERYREECADYLKQTGRWHFCPAYEGLSFRYFAGLSRDQVGDLSDMQKSEYDSLMNSPEGDCVPVDVARTTAWQCQTLPYYLGELAGLSQLGMDTSYYRNELTERYQVVCLGMSSEKSRKFSMGYLVGAAIVGAGGVYLYGRYRKSRETASQT